MARRHREVLAKLDPLAVARYQIIEKDIQTIEQYLKIIQAEWELEGVSLWQEIIDFPGGYATSLVVHELVEIRLLEAQGINPLNLSTDALQNALAANIDAHIQATYDEHVFLQNYISRHQQQFFQVGTLLKVNRDDDEEVNLQLLLGSDVGIVIIEDDKLESARQVIAMLKGEAE